MKALNVEELDRIIDSLQAFRGSVLQKVLSFERGLQLSFWSSEHGLQHLFIDLTPASPVALPVENESAIPYKKRNKPVGLFIKANLLQSRLTSIRRQVDFGRVLCLELTQARQPDPGLIRLVLVPHAANIEVHAAGKQIFWSKPRDLQKGQGDYSPTQVRKIDKIREQWLKKCKPQGRGVAASQIEKRWQTEVKKKSATLKKMKTLVKTLEHKPWKEAGLWIQSHQSLKGPQEYLECIDNDKDLAENIEHCFSQARLKEAKTLRLRERIQTAVEELEVLQKEGSDAWWAKKSKLKDKRVKLRSTGKSVRQKTFGGFRAASGRNARENLQLLREAPAWSLWLHLKDVPSSHAVIYRNKSQKVPEKILHQAVRWLIELNFSGKSTEIQQEPFQVLVAELRYVRPIKGDRLGRVTYHNERVLRVRAK